MKSFGKAYRNVKRTVKKKKAEQFLFELHVHSIDSLPEWLQDEPLKLTWIRGKKLQFTRNSESDGSSGHWDQKLSMMGKIYTGGKDKDEKKKFESKTCQLKVSKVLPPRKGGKSELPIGVLALDLSSFVNLNGDSSPRVETLNLHIRLTTAGKLAVAILNVTLKSTWMNSIDSDASSDGSSVGFMSEEESDDGLDFQGGNGNPYSANNILSEDLASQLQLPDAVPIKEADEESKSNRGSTRLSAMDDSLLQSVDSMMQPRPRTTDALTRPEPKPEPVTEKTSLGPSLQDAQCEADANRMATQVLQMEKQLAQAKDENQAMHERLSAVTQELELALQYHHEVEADRNQAQSELQSARNHIGMLTGRIEHLTQALEESNKRVQQLTAHLQDARAGRETVETAASGEVANLQSVIDQLRAQVEDANRSLVRADTEKHNIEVELSKCQRASKCTSQSAASLSQEIAGLKEQLAEEKKKVAELESGVSTTPALKRTSSEANTKSDKKTLLAEIDSLKLELHQSNTSRDSINKKYSELQKTVTTMEVRYQQAKTECVQAKVKLGESEYSRNKLEIDLKEAKTELEKRPVKKGLFG